jgi:hypothetical protein
LLTDQSNCQVTFALGKNWRQKQSEGRKSLAAEKVAGKEGWLAPAGWLSLLSLLFSQEVERNQPAGAGHLPYLQILSALEFVCC